MIPTQSQRFSRCPIVEEIVGQGIALLNELESAPSSSITRIVTTIGIQNQ